MKKRLNISWKFGGSLNRYCVPSMLGVYIHILRGRIIYVGEGIIDSCQKRHYTKAKNEKAFLFNLIEIDRNEISDLYELICNDNYLVNLNNNYLLDQNNIKDEPNKKKIINLNLLQTSIYFNVTDDKKLSQKIEAGIQDFLIKKYNMDQYEEGLYPIGNRKQDRNNFDKDILICNDFFDILI